MTRLHTQRWGPDAAAARALLLHGITSSAATMWEVGEGLAAAGWSAVAVDLPGHGGSGPAGSYRFADVAGLLAAQLGGGWDLLVGHSLGGALGVVLLAGHPATAARALLVDPALVVDDDAADGLVREPTTGTDVDAVRGWTASNRPWDVRAAARAVGVPVHVLVPTDEPMVTGGLVADLSGGTRAPWTFETVPDTTHSVHRDRPGLVVDRALRPPAGR